MRQKEFVEKYIDYAKETEAKTGISFLFTLAQAALESTWGDQAVGNMFFGIKASASTPIHKKQLLQTREVLETQNAKFPVIISITKRKDGRYDYKVKDWFRKYESPEESFTDHANFLIENKKFRQALEFRSDPYRFTDLITAAKYATDRNYASVLKSVIRTVVRNLPK